MKSISATTITAENAKQDLIDWASHSIDSLYERLHLNGLVLLRGFATSRTAAQDMLTLLGANLLEEVFWSTPRKRVNDKTFTATEYSSLRTIRLHSEMSYASHCPRLLSFHAIETAATGGETMLGDIGAISRDLIDITERFDVAGVRYLRTFRPSIDIPFEVAFGVSSRGDAVAEARARGMTVEILENDIVRVQLRGRGALRDKQTGAPLWFNQMHLFHGASLDPKDRQNLISIFGASNLPRHATFGDGSPIPDDVVHRVNDTLRSHSVNHVWRDGDVLLIDNMRYMHGRQPYTGCRVLHVAMAHPVSTDFRKPLLGGGARH